MRENEWKDRAREFLSDAVKPCVTQGGEQKRGKRPPKSPKEVCGRTAYVHAYMYLIYLTLAVTVRRACTAHFLQFLQIRLFNSSSYEWKIKVGKMRI